MSYAAIIIIGSLMSGFGAGARDIGWLVLGFVLAVAGVLGLAYSGGEA
ncbi:hypothetical protein FF098_014970 [Parvularcula flava]|uniref:Uncharacterized protein n=1 Tax=Aquisalinus luteolus TaxID=1566827 RepID=A0A8J3A3B4_9PROT|nr:hypothetical protein [Aquisalinus luteolus]NHK29220.1 hypothetical protein [Aquisalinus luteolus]GGH99924.1 hypothetical protein GCM10011355_27010 [Aquisalinus luteolus]